MHVLFNKIYSISDCVKVISDYFTRRGVKEGGTVQSRVRLFAISDNRITLDSFLILALGGAEFRFTPAPLYPRGRGCQYLLCRRLGGSQSMSGCFREK